MSYKLPRTVQILLISAAQIIRTRGWCRGTMRNEEGAVCLLSALLEAGTGQTAAAVQIAAPEHYDPLTSAACEIVERLINERYGKIYGTVLNIPAWNDQPSRTVEDVLKILDDAAGLTK